jgi:hypothetical protein
MPRPAAGENPGSYWQVIGADPQTPARLLFETLKRNGFQVAYLQVPPGNLRVRVMVGPFFSNADVAKAEQALIAAGFKPLRVW